MAILTDHQDLATLRRSGRILASALKVTAAAVRPGVTTKELNDIAERAIRDAGAIPAFLGYQGYPASLCTSINEEVVHGLPSRRALKDGDIIGLDVGVNLDGMYTDGAVTVPVGTVTPAIQTLINDTAQALLLALREVKPGKHIGDIGAAIQAFIEPKGYGIIRQLTGHGVGRGVHEAPSIPNWGKRGSGPEIVEGMVLAIEPMVSLGGYDVITKPDGWTVATVDGSPAAHAEHTVLVTARGAEIITK